MKVETREAKSLERILVRSLPRKSWTDFYLTGLPAEGESASDVYAEAATILATLGIQVIQEKAYAPLDGRDEVLQAREDAFRAQCLDPSLPVTCLDYQPARGSGFAGLQIWGVAPHARGKQMVRTVRSAGTTPGRLVTGPGSRMLYLPLVRGEKEDGTLPAGVTCQARRMFHNASEGLRANGFSYCQVVRTWIYLSRLLDWYGEFNRVRTAHHAREGFDTESPETAFPASTGIQGRHTDEECCMDVLAVAPGDSVFVNPIRGSARQNQAYCYGSGFSRGMRIEAEGGRTIHISGTASINPSGESVHRGDPDAQCLETLLCIASILKDQGGGLEDVCSATLFFKDRPAFDAYRQVTALLGIQDFPGIPVLADVCRPDLHIEIEAVAIL